MDITEIDGYSIKNIDHINILMGKNGCGKSSLLRTLELQLGQSEEDIYGNIIYISPERGGLLKYDSSVAQNSYDNPDWIAERNRQNSSAQFKEQTFLRFSNLEVSTFRKQQEKQNIADFSKELKSVNDLLDNVLIVQDGQAFKVTSKSGVDIETNKISSGESEMISLTIECLSYAIENDPDKINLLLLDEPDVHLHPDLQVKFMRFLQGIANEKSIIIVATHSTAIMGAFQDYDAVNICFMDNDQKEIKFKSITDVYRKILPIFGAHPLSNIFNQIPILIVEGEDDVRIWQQVIRTSRGDVNLYPCEAGDIQSMDEMESDAKEIIDSIYDSAVGYSLRDGDDIDEDIDDKLPIFRFRTSCRNMENLILSNEILGKCNKTWDEMKNDITEWLTNDINRAHSSYSNLKSFQDADYDRKNHQLKEFRNTLVYLLGSNKPWEILVGQVISENIQRAEESLIDDNGIFNYLGRKITENIFIQK